MINVWVSIHALLAECDPVPRKMSSAGNGFNPRTPCGVRLASTRAHVTSTQFQSTHSLRSATFFWLLLKLFHVVSIHALLAECDCMTDALVTLTIWFQSTHSLRSATVVSFNSVGLFNVSIHALLAECDGRLSGLPGRQPRFNPRTPCGVRPNSTSSLSSRESFQSTHSLRSATDGGKTPLRLVGVSIHALLAECDQHLQAARRPFDVSIHALLAECDAITRASARSGERFNPRTPCGVRHRDAL